MTKSKYSIAFDRMTTRVKQDEEIQGYQRVLSTLIVWMASFAWVAFAFGYLLGNDWQASGVFWLGAAWVTAVQVFWTFQLGKLMLEHHELLEANSDGRRPQDRLR